MKHFDNIERTALYIGAQMLESGAEIFRVEDTIERILKSGGICDINVFCISSVIIVSAGESTYIARIRKSSLDLFQIDWLNSLSRAICNKSDFSDTQNIYPQFIKLISIMLGTGSFCLYFGGNIYDALFSGIIGIVITYLPNIVSGVFPKTFCDSAIAGCLAFLSSFLLPQARPDKIMIGTIMLLIPGLTVSNAMRDIMSSDTLSGVIELTQAIFTALAIALGFAFAVVLFG